MDRRLKWPMEASRPDYADGYEWNQSGSNLCLDFHGDPVTSKLVVFSDGNHHMALEACCQAFLQDFPEVQDVFYATTPPRVILDAVTNKGISIGNLHLNVQPDVFISPKNILDNLAAKNLITSHQAFAKSLDNVLLVSKNNPKNIRGISDLLRDDVTLTISNPITEAASYHVYKQTLLTAAEEQNLDISAFEKLIEKNSTQVIFGESIHHREVPQTLYSGDADVAVVYYHLALRYTRIFPNDFEFIELNTKAKVQNNYHIGLMNNTGKWGQSFIDFMLSDKGVSIYKSHGLTHIE